MGFSDDCCKYFKYLKKLFHHSSNPRTLGTWLTFGCGNQCLRLCSCCDNINAILGRWTSPHRFSLLHLHWCWAQLQCPWQRGNGNFWSFQVLETLSRGLRLANRCHHWRQKIWNISVQRNCSPKDRLVGPNTCCNLTSLSGFALVSLEWSLTP